GELDAVGLCRADPLIAQQDAQLGVNQAAYTLWPPPVRPTRRAGDGDHSAAKELGPPGDPQVKVGQQPRREHQVRERQRERHRAFGAIAGLQLTVAFGVYHLDPVPAIRGNLEASPLLPSAGTGFSSAGPDLTG